MWKHSLSSALFKTHVQFIPHPKLRNDGFNFYDEDGGQLGSRFLEAWASRVVPRVPTRAYLDLGLNMFVVATNWGCTGGKNIAAAAASDKVHESTRLEEIVLHPRARF